MTKGIVQPQIKTLSSFTHSHVDPNILCDIRRYFEECW